MEKKKKLYLYPNSKAHYEIGNNNYIKDLHFNLQKHFQIINEQTSLGLIDVLFKIHKIDILYFNWVEDIPERKFGFVQFLLLLLVLVVAKILNIKTIWFIHNNLSHSKKNLFLKKIIVRVMRGSSNIILSHSNELKINIPRHKFNFFPHPIDPLKPVTSNETPEYDLLIWGTVSTYKGVDSFIDYVSQSGQFKNLKILIAGKFESVEYFEKIKSKQLSNLTIINRKLQELELIELFYNCRFVLFTYNSSSVLSSAALCKTLSFGKSVIGPNIGAFRELGLKRIIFNYDSFNDIPHLLDDLKNNKRKLINHKDLNNYIMSNSWSQFALFIKNETDNLYKKTHRLFSDF